MFVHRLSFSKYIIVWVWSWWQCRQLDDTVCSDPKYVISVPYVMSWSELQPRIYYSPESKALLFAWPTTHTIHTILPNKYMYVMYDTDCVCVCLVCVLLRSDVGQVWVVTGRQWQCNVLVWVWVWRPWGKQGQALQWDCPIWDLGALHDWYRETPLHYSLQLQHNTKETYLFLGLLLFKY